MDISDFSINDCFDFAFKSPPKTIGFLVLVELLMLGVPQIIQWTMNETFYWIGSCAWTIALMGGYMVLFLHAVDGKELNLKVLFSQWHAAWKFLLTGAIFFIVSLIGIAMLVLPGLAIISLLDFCFFSLAEGASPLHSLKVSVELVSPHFGKILGVYGLLTVMIIPIFLFVLLPSHFLLQWLHSPKYIADTFEGLLSIPLSIYPGLILTHAYRQLTVLRSQKLDISPR
jgi:hypothetical protein